MTIAKASEHTAWGTVVVFTQTSAANTAQTCSTDGLMPYKILFATMDATGSATSAVTYTLNSAVGSAYDTLIETDGAATSAVFIPSFEFILRTGDALDVAAGTASGSDTTSVAIYCLMLDDD